MQNGKPKSTNSLMAFVLRGLFKINKMKYLIYSLFSVLILIQCSPAANVSAEDAVNIETLVKEHKFVFEAESITPLRGQRKFLSGGYNVTVNRDSLSAELPFIGQSQMPAMNRDEAGTYFTTTKYNYKLEMGNKNNWLITLDIEDQKFTRQIVMNVFSNGKTTVNVYSNFRDPTSFSGYIRDLKK